MSINAIETSMIGAPLIKYDSKCYTNVDHSPKMHSFLLLPHTVLQTWSWTDFTIRSRPISTWFLHLPFFAWYSKKVWMQGFMIPVCSGCHFIATMGTILQQRHVSYHVCAYVLCVPAVCLERLQSLVLNYQKLLYDIITYSGALFL